MIPATALLGALRRAEEVLHRLGVSSARSLQQCIDHVVHRRPHPPPSISVIIFVPNIILVEKQRDEEIYCAPGEDDLQAKVRESEGAKALLLEIVRRAAYDWVLYRDSVRPEQKALAEEAYCWLFQEEEGHSDFELRRQERKEFTGFLSICDALDMDVDRVRSYICRLTPNRVSSRRQPHTSKSVATSSQKKSSSVFSVKSVDYDDLILSLLDADVR